MVKTKARRFDLFAGHIGNMKIAPRRSNRFTRHKAFGGRFRLLLFKLPVLVGIPLRRDCFKGLARNVAINPLAAVRAAACQIRGSAAPARLAAVAATR